MDSLKSRGYLGVNVTIPYKKEILAYLDSLSDEALHIGAVNTVCLSVITRDITPITTGLAWPLRNTVLKQQERDAPCWAAAALRGPVVAT